MRIEEGDLIVVRKKGQTWEDVVGLKLNDGRKSVAYEACDWKADPTRLIVKLTKALIKAGEKTHELIEVADGSDTLYMGVFPIDVKLVGKARKTISIRVTYNSEEITQSIIPYFPNHDGGGTDMKTGLRDEFFFIKYISADQLTYFKQVARNLRRRKGVKEVTIDLDDEA